MNSANENILESFDDITYIIGQCAIGNIKAQEILYRKYYGYGMGIALRYTTCRENAVEVLNDSFLKVFNKIDSYDIEKNFNAWLRRIIINTSIDAYRREKKTFELHENHEFEIMVDNDAISKMKTEEILKIIQRLPSQYRMVFNLFEIEGYTHEEISQILNINVSTSRSNLSRAKNKIREIIQSQYEN